MDKKIPSEKRFSNCLKNNSGASGTPESQQTTRKCLLCHIFTCNNCQYYKVMLFHWNKKTLHGSSHSHRLTGIIAERQPHHLMISTTSQELKSWKNILKKPYNTTGRKPRRFPLQLKASIRAVSQFKRVKTKQAIAKINSCITQYKSKETLPFLL